MKMRNRFNAGIRMGVVLIILSMGLAFLPGSVQAAGSVTPMVAAGRYHTVGLKADGTVVAVGDNRYGQGNVGGWTDIRQVAAGYYHTVGLKADGTVVAVGDNNNGQCDVSGWTDIRQVAAGDLHTVGLKADGTVVAVGQNYSGQGDVGGWTDIRQVAAGRYHTVGLKADGTVVAVGHKVAGQGDVGSGLYLGTFPNIPPTVNAGPDATINEEGTYNSSGSFTDPDDDTWTATVDYGDGSSEQPLALNPDKTFTLSHTYADSGTYTVTVTVAADNGGVGSDTAVIAVITVDGIAPATLATLSGTTGNNGWYVSDVALSLVASDNDGGSGVKEIHYRINDGEETIVAGASALFNLTAEGESVVTYFAKDNAGNTEAEKSLTVKIDKTKPVISVNSPQAKDYLTSESITLDFSATDATSGVGNLVAALDGTPVTNGQVINLETMAGSHTLTVSATDNAGNSHRAEVTFQVVIVATVDIDPDTLNLKSKSDKNAITAYIELPAGYNVTDINVATVRLKVDGTEIVAQLTPTSVGDYDKDGVADRMVKFDRQAVIAALAGRTGDITLTVSGELANGWRFSGTDTIKVINPGKKK